MPVTPSLRAIAQTTSASTAKIGLLLTPTIDHLFDKGFISFEGTGALLVSPVADATSLRRIGVDPEGRVNVGAFSAGQRRLLEYHRDNVLRMAHRPKS